MPSTTLKFTYDRETKHMARFKEDGDAKIIGTLYVRKTLLEEWNSPATLTVKIESS